jgi:hypothetical protein
MRKTVETLLCALPARYTLRVWEEPIESIPTVWAEIRTGNLSSEAKNKNIHFILLVPNDLEAVELFIEHALSNMRQTAVQGWVLNKKEGYVAVYPRRLHPYISIWMRTGERFEGYSSMSLNNLNYETWG